MILPISLAYAADCEPLDAAEVRDRVATAKAAVDRDDLVTFAQARRDLLQDLPCLGDPLPVDAWARFLLDDAVVTFALGERWEPSLATALSLSPGLPRGDLPAELRDWIAPPPAPTAGKLAPGEFLLDGLPLFGVPELPGVHVLQRTVGGVTTTRVLRDAPFPSEWRATPPGPPPAASRSHGRVPVVVAGLAVAVVGAGVGIGSWAVRESVEEPAAGDRLVLVNVAGWSLAGVGAALGGVGLALPGERAVGLQVHGGF